MALESNVFGFEWPIRMHELNNFENPLKWGHFFFFSFLFDLPPSLTYELWPCRRKNKADTAERAYGVQLDPDKHYRSLVLLYKIELKIYGTEEAIVHKYIVYNITPQRSEQADKFTRFS